jgi:rhamnosyltransferase
MNAIEISVVIPTRRGGTLLERVARAVLGQRGSPPFELLLVDSGSPAEELERLRALGARVESIPPETFDHGATRDLGARRALGQVLVFLNQDALPVGERWLERLTAPLRAADPPAAVQGAIREFPEGETVAGVERRFYWDSGGRRFNFTRESRDWIARHGGIGFSTVHCAIRRDVWARIPFGAAPILEDKKWQKAVVADGERIVELAADQALVWHSHHYDLGSLLRRSADEGFGWRAVGERYRLTAALADAAGGAVWREWRAAARAGRLATAAERLFPLARPLGLWWGNRWATRLRR